MFITAPTPAQIIGQFTILTHHMEFLYKHNLALDLKINHWHNRQLLNTSFASYQGAENSFLHALVIYLPAKDMQKN